MSFLDKLQESLAQRVAEGVWIGLSALVLWCAYQLSPAVLPAIENVSKEALAGLLLASIMTNAVLAVICWRVSRPAVLRLKYGVYWDREKNPHCPACKTPVCGYSEYTMARVKGYYCKACSEVIPLADVAGRDIDPEKAVSEL